VLLRASGYMIDTRNRKMTTLCASLRAVHTGAAVAQPPLLLLLLLLLLLQVLAANIVLSSQTRCDAILHRRVSIDGSDPCNSDVSKQLAADKLYLYRKKCLCVSCLQCELQAATGIRLLFE
jgi:hypothetical protein